MSGCCLQGRVPVMLLVVLLVSRSSTVCGQQPEIIYRTALSEAGQSGVCVQADHLYLTVHATLHGPLNGGFHYNGHVIGQCFDRRSGELQWQVQLPGTYEGKVLESWHDSTSLLPVATDRYVIFHNLNGMLMCCTHAGEPVWKRTWQAPDPDIKNCRMYIEDGQLLVALPSEEIAVPSDGKHPDLPFYQLHCIQIATGEDLWVSPQLITHATQYSPADWKGQRVIAASMIDLTHWKFGSGRRGFLLSVKDGQAIAEFDLPAAIPHQKNQLCNGQFLVTSPAGSRTAFQLVDPLDGSITATWTINRPDRYYAWRDEEWQLTEFVPEYTDKTLRGKGQPTPSTVHVVDSRIYFWRYDSGDICCLDTKTGESVFVEVPIQVLPGQTVWNRSEFRFTNGIRNSRDEVVNQRVGSVRGILRGGFGHTNPAWPQLVDGTLFWQGGAGVLYLIDTKQPFGPQAVSWKSIEQQACSWTFGEPGIDDASIYVRSQRELIRLAR